MSSEAKSWLSSTVRKLRESLLKGLRDEVESVYRLSIPLSGAELDEAHARRRQRLEAYLDSRGRQTGGGAKETKEAARKRHLGEAVKLAAATFLNRLVVMRQMEALGLLKTKLLTGGWGSLGFKEMREFAPGLNGEAEAMVLRLAFEELALDLPGLFGDVGVNSLIPIPVSTLKPTIEALESCGQQTGLSGDEVTDLWADDTLLGWVYQFWNDPEREALDEKIRNRGKIENHEIAAKTQLFTDRYMVEWLLQNSLGQLWFAVCKSNGWTPEVVANGTLDRLEVRREEWQGMRERGEVDAEALMPLENEAEERWKYYVPRVLGSQVEVWKERAEGPEHLTSVRDLKLLDPACGSGHFLVIAFDLLAALYEEEARHRGVSWTPEQIATSIIERNLHGIDIDPRAVQIAAAALWLKMKVYAPLAKPRQMNLVASNLGLSSLPTDDPALLSLQQAVEGETGIPAALTLSIVESLKGADHLGSLLKVGESIDKAIEEHESAAGLSRFSNVQGDLWDGFAEAKEFVTRDQAKASLHRRLSEFLTRHSGADDLGLRLLGEQLAAGVRFIQIAQEGQYHLVVGNPPYAGSGSMSDTKYLEKHYRDGKADVCVAFMMRGLELVRPGGLQVLLTLRGWMFLRQFENIRRALLRDQSLQLIGDFDWGAFEQIVGHVLSVTAAVFRKAAPKNDIAVAIQPFPQGTPYRNDNRRAYRKQAATLVNVGYRQFTPEHLSVIPGHPLIYWWDEEFLRLYAGHPKLGAVSDVRVGLQTSNNVRFIRRPWELLSTRVAFTKVTSDLDCASPALWVPFGKGASGIAWIEPPREAIDWSHNGLEVKVFAQYLYGSYTRTVKNEAYYFVPGVAFAAIGAEFSARLHRYRTVFGHMGSSVFPQSTSETLCLLNSTRAQDVLNSLNPGVHFEVGDVNRLPLFPIESAEEIVHQLDLAFTEHEQARETSVEFKKPGPSAWTYAQEWAQRAVDRPAGEPLPPYTPTYQAETPTDHLSFALGIALGRFADPKIDIAGSAPVIDIAGSVLAGSGILDTAPTSALPNGILFLSTAGAGDSLEHPACAPLHTAWETYGEQIAKTTKSSSSGKQTLRNYLREKFFTDDHLKRYEKRPIYFPLTSSKKSFVAWVSIHRWKDDTLQTLLADYLQPELSRLAGELADLMEARSSGDRAAQTKAHSRYEQVNALCQELQTFTKLVGEIAERGAPPVEGKGLTCPPREVNARFKINLDDGVMINSAALWPLLPPQWKEPARWWTELCADSPKNYDWSHLAARYFPTRVDAKCQQDPSLAVAHGVFWKYHPAKAYQWELRLQSPDELGPSFQLDEEGHEAYRAQFLAADPERAVELCEAEQKRRDRKARKADESESESDQMELDEVEEE